MNYLCYTQNKFSYSKIKRILLSDYLGQLTKKIKNSSQGIITKNKLSLLYPK